MPTHAPSRFALLLLLLLLAMPAAAQRIIGDLETNTDKDMIAGEDSINGENGKKRKKNVPVDVRAWTIDPIVGTRTPADVDTLRHRFQNANHNEGPTGHYSSLSNLGSPRLSRIYMERQADDYYIFITPFTQFFQQDGQFKYYNTKSPYMNLTYQWCGSKTSGDDHFQALFANNIGKRLNFGGYFDYIYGKGYYDNQSTSFMNATAFANYLGDRYDLHFHYTHNFMKMGENGGIEDDIYITNPEDLSQSYRSGDIPTNLTKTWNRQEHDLIYLNHRYNIGFTRVDSDSIHGLRREFVPVTSIFHTFTLRSMRKNYRSYENPTDFYTYDFLPGDSASNHYRYTQISNYLGLSLREGFNKYALAGINAYVGFVHSRYAMPDTLASAATTTESRRKFTQSDIVIGAQLIRTQGHTLHYNAQAQFNVAGDNAGDLRLSGQADLNIPLLGDTARLDVSALLSNVKPSPFYSTYHAKHAWWDNDFDRISQTRLMATLTLPRYTFGRNMGGFTQLKAGVENIKNMVYIADQGTLYSTDDDGTAHYTHNALAMQESGNIQVVHLGLQQNFRFGPLHLENEVTFQTTTNEDVLPLPRLNTYNNIYFDFRIAKVLHCELGADMTYFTKYYAPDYSPAVGLFMTQNKDSRIQIGNYPLISVYANFYLKKTRFYVQYYHVNQSDGNYFWAPHYPMNPQGLHFGISWNFYD